MGAAGALKEEVVLPPPPKNKPAWDPVAFEELVLGMKGSIEQLDGRYLALLDAVTQLKEEVVTRTARIETKLDRILAAMGLGDVG